jgi:pyruvate dehydrogenase E2 component (dihydrolipoamide acetyltransferase)
MANKVIMPKQGLQMTEGLITKWLVKEGSAVKEGEPLFEMETDKLSITMDAAFSGTLLKIVRGEGETVPITETIAIIGEKGEDYSALLAKNDEVKTEEITPKAIENTPAAIENKKSGERIFATPLAKTRSEEKGISIDNINGTGPDGLIIERDVLSQSTVKATPTAKKIAELSNVSLGDIESSGVNGKIMKADVLNHINQIAGVQNETIIEISGMRKAIFNNMLNSLHTMAQANHRMKVDMTEAVRFREKLKESGKKASFTDILVKVVSEALIKFPMLNSTVVDNTIVQKHYVNMGIAVALPNGLIVPNIKNSHLMSLEMISENISTLAKKAREGKLSKDEYSNGTFTITNLGMYDLDEFTAVINPPEAAILAIGKIADTPVCVGKAVEIRPILTLSLTYDHRIIDGAPAAEFLQYIKKLLQNPYLLI